MNLARVQERLDERVVGELLAHVSNASRELIDVRDHRLPVDTDAGVLVRALYDRRKVGPLHGLRGLAEYARGRRRQTRVAQDLFDTHAVRGEPKDVGRRSCIGKTPAFQLVRDLGFAPRNTAPLFPPIPDEPPARIVPVETAKILEELER